MLIGILGGTGDLGLGLASRWLKVGHKILIGSRKIESAINATKKLGLADSSGKLNIDVARDSDICCLTIPYANHGELLKTLIEPLKNKILIDSTVPLLPPKVMRAQLPKEGSAAIQAQNILDKTTTVISAFQNVSAELLQSDNKINCDVLVCGDQKDAREIVINLIKDIGLTAWHGGPLCNSSASEALTSVLIAINKNHSIKHSGIKITGI
tara:strand:+ start:10034 stop:10666 length:633 start_codon:yes stop_codon:yes gene_type:complete